MGGISRLVCPRACPASAAANAGAGCWIDVERIVYRREPNGEVVLIGGPDETVVADYTAAAWRPTTSVAVAEPRVIHEVVLDPDELEQFKQDYLIVRELG